MHRNLQIVYKPCLRLGKKPEGIRDDSGFLLFFPDRTAYQGQDERYKSEISEQQRLAEEILSLLSART